ncbi:MAG: hypothetical protein FD174_426 [Geobacteraceae bacterium]|nr:MAG: hypothetical protein FD174_426 [Geobacteraceae bacterium]
MAKNAVRVFLDSNVILSGLFSDKGAPRIILDLLSLRLSAIAGLTGEYNIIEIERNLTCKMPKVIPVYKRYFAKLNMKIVPLPSKAEVEKYTGHIADKDVPVLVSAINGRADYLVTGDKKDFGKIKKGDNYPFKIVSPAEFLDSIAPEILKTVIAKEPA